MKFVFSLLMLTLTSLVVTTTVTQSPEFKTAREQQSSFDCSQCQAYRTGTSAFCIMRGVAGGTESGANPTSSCQSSCHPSSVPGSSNCIKNGLLG